MNWERIYPTARAIPMDAKYAISRAQLPILATYGCGGGNVRCGLKISDDFVKLPRIDQCHIKPSLSHKKCTTLATIISKHSRLFSMGIIFVIIFISKVKSESFENVHSVIYIGIEIKYNAN